MGCYILNLSLPEWARAGSTNSTCLGGWWGKQESGHKSLPCLKKQLHPNGGIRTNNHSSAGKAVLWEGEEAVWLSLSAKRFIPRFIKVLCHLEEFERHYHVSLQRAHGCPELAGKAATERAKQWDLVLGQKHSWQLLRLVFLPQHSTKAQRGFVCVILNAFRICCFSCLDMFSLWVQFTSKCDLQKQGHIPTQIPGYCWERHLLLNEKGLHPFLFFALSWTGPQRKLLWHLATSDCRQRWTPWLLVWGKYRAQ